MSDNSLGPKYLFSTDYYRLEEYIDGVHPSLEETNTNIFRKMIAHKAAQIHNLAPTEIDHTPVLQKALDSNSPIILAFKEKLKSVIKRYPDYQPLLRQIDNEIEIAYSLLPKKNENNIKFCHNDLNNLNIFKLKSSLNQQIPELMLIDYEYSGYNYRGLDLGNFFNEQTFDYNVNEDPYFKQNIENYPVKKEIEEIIMYYLYFYYCIKMKIPYSQEDVLFTQAKLQEKIKEYFNEKSFFQERDEIVDEIYTCSMLSHFFWTIWGVINSGTEDIKFNYMVYCQKKFDSYEFFKRQIKKN